MGMPECEAIIREAMRFFGRPYPRDREARIAMLDGAPRKTREERDPFEKLDDRFFELLKTENGGFEVAADGYATGLE